MGHLLKTIHSAAAGLTRTLSGLTSKMLDLRNGADNDDRVVTDETYTDRIAEGCLMMGVRLTRVTFIRCDLYWSLWFLAELTEVVFDRCDLRGAAFNDATLTRCRFIDTDVGTDALGGLTDWGNADLSTTTFIRCRGQ
ncbi:pentapeptide repeat-containing protein [Candidatus Laterigemmans baculatus]|uniref:pentapeptide repeat-containing protein n=1 Tax=Candidatus Laterigemmans baculatus TaxID=2770505 RepID=UPI0013DD05EE|nr:pentapeptide repeat-containing protein [Candidatus Laterigemmans baculatus]